MSAPLSLPIVTFENMSFTSNNDKVMFAFNQLKKDPSYDPAEQVLIKEGGGEASFLLGRLYLQRKDVQSAIMHLEKSDRGVAKHTLAAIYYHGLHGVPKNEEKAIQYLTEAHNLGSYRATISLGILHWHKGEKEAAHPYLKQYVPKKIDFSQEEKNSVADYVAQNPIDNAHSIVEQADSSLKADLFRKLGESYKNLKQGKKVQQAWEAMADNIPKDSKPSRGQQAALCTLGRMVYQSENDENHQKAVEYWTKAATAGSPEAQYYLGLAHCSGKGVQKDIEKGKEWLQKAEAKKCVRARVALNHLEGKEKMTPSLAKDDTVKLSSKEEDDFVEGQKNFLGKAWSWIKRNSTNILIATISSVAGAALIAGLAVLTVFFPQVMIPIWIGAGVITGLIVVGGGLFGLAFAAGSGDRGALQILSHIAR